MLPRYAEFAEANPHIDVQFTAFLAADESVRAPCDARLQYGSGRWPGMKSDYLCGRRICMVASPRLLRSGSGVSRPADLLRYRLLEHFETPDLWPDAMMRLGITKLGSMMSTRHEFYSAIIAAALAGLGVALVPKSFIAHDLAKGTLEPVLNFSFIARDGYYVTYLPDRASDPAVLRLRSWLIDIGRSSERE